MALSGMTVVRDALNTRSEIFSPPARRAVSSILWRQRRWLVTVPCLSAAIGLIILLFIPNYFTSTSSFIPASKSGSGMGNLAELAAVAGVAGASTANPSSPQFYEQVLASTPIVYNVLSAKFPAPRAAYSVPRGVDSVRLFELLSSPRKGESERMADAAA
jgi:hypothetical protein